MKSLIALGTLVPAVIGDWPGLSRPFFPNCKEKTCYADIEGASGNRTRLEAFCRDSMALEKPQTGKFGFASNKTACGDLGRLDTIRATCDCIVNDSPILPEGTMAGKQDGADKKNDAPPPKVPGPEWDPALNVSNYFYPDCVKKPCYSFLDLSSRSAEKLRSFCEKSRGPSPATDELRRVDEQALIEHCAEGPDMPTTWNPKYLKPACDCVLGAKADDTFAGNRSTKS
ncbi:hypothetical protein CDD83_10343 [Cordyceps sp. RAO-2017]|nr:hypothetical protein CDD83_10343 [Cordyceps sp. RAO-2017]